MPDLLVLREAHLKAFRAAGLARFRRKAATILRMRFPADCAKRSAEEFHERIESWTKQARGAGLLTERQMIRYLASEVLLSRVEKLTVGTRDTFARLRDTTKPADQRSIDILQFAANQVKSPMPVF